MTNLLGFLYNGKSEQDEELVDVDCRSWPDFIKVVYFHKIYQKISKFN